MILFLKLLMGHAIADFVLQGEPMAKGKNRHNKVVPPAGQKYIPCWPYWLTAHALTHGAVVWAVTGRWELGLIETMSHWIIDFFKCENKTNPHQDQMMHITMKAIYCIL